MKLFKYAFVALFALPFFASCSKDDEPTLPVETAGSKGALVINQGTFGRNNASFSVIDYEKGNTAITTTFGSVDDTPQNAVKVGDYIYVSVNGTNSVDVFRTDNLNRIASIYVSKPQGITASGKYVYVVGDKTVSRIDTEERRIDGVTSVGDNAWAATVANGAIYVTRGNSGYGGTPTVSIVSKISLDAFTPGKSYSRKEIAVGLNPYNQIGTDGRGNVILICAGNYSTIEPEVWRIDAQDNAKFFCYGDYIALRGTTLFVAENKNLYTNKPSYMTYNTESMQKVNSNFLAKASVTPIAVSFLAVNPKTGGIYFGSNPYGYNVAGSLFEYTNDGQYVKTHSVGINPYSMVFY